MVILIAEDVEDTRNLMKVLLEHEGHEVDTAANGQEVIAAATQRLPDVILMDLCMPVMDGLTATRALRKMPETCCVPIIAVSGHVAEGTWADRSKSAGCNDCLGKPIDLDTLAVMLRRFMPPAAVSMSDS